MTVFVIIVAPRGGERASLEYEDNAVSLQRCMIRQPYINCRGHHNVWGIEKFSYLVDICHLWLLIPVGVFSLGTSNVQSKHAGEKFVNIQNEVLVRASNTTLQSYKYCRIVIMYIFHKNAYNTYSTLRRWHAGVSIALASSDINCKMQYRSVLSLILL